MVLDLLFVFSIIILGIAFILIIAYFLQRMFVEHRFLPSRTHNYQGPRYPKPNTDLLHQIETIVPSHDFGIEYRPCLITLVDGKSVDCIYVVSEELYFKHWGVWPEDDNSKHSMRIQDVVKIEESPSRLPPLLADELYKAGESGMGYFRFTLVFSDNSEQTYVTGDAVDFLPWPAGKSKSDVLKVLPHAESDKNYKQGLKYYWCLYS